LHVFDVPARLAHIVDLMTKYSTNRLTYLEYV